MKWFVNLSTRNKLLCGFGLIVLLLALVVIVAYGGIKTIQEGYKGIVAEELGVVTNLLEFRVELNRQRVAMLRMMMSTDRREQELLEKEVRQAAKLKDEYLQRLAQAGSKYPQVLKSLEELKEDSRQARDQIAEMRTELAVIKQRASLWGAVSGCVGAVLTISGAWIKTRLSP